MKKKVFSKSMAWLLSVVMIFGVFMAVSITKGNASTPEDFNNKLNALCSLSDSVVSTDVFPGMEDTSYDVPAMVTAKRKDNTYDDYGNMEANHWIDAGDRCYVEKVYKNGFCRVQYPAGNEMRWAYAKASIFSWVVP
ncbi:MAG: hypothetical protein VZR27_13405, partial [Acutalibacteraceae bacterium]|nr:hypothetical protein [Acutalibacteraceae bacterium]